MAMSSHFVTTYCTTKFCGKQGYVKMFLKRYREDNHRHNGSCNQSCGNPIAALSIVG